ncbi:cation transporter [Nocardioides sp. CCNWLW239]|uniref:cation transporter n=1 Tax=Nocardioides sp. CCNWLW239 TaxID=3128902 RepID=UPI0030179DFA
MSSGLPIHVIGRGDGVAPQPGPDPSRRAVLVRRVRLLVTFTIAYNLIEAAVAIAAGAVAGSAALLGFGLDSLIEVTSAIVVAWQFAGREPEAREKVALRIIALSFFGLAAVVSYDAVTSLITGHMADHSGLGIGIAALSLLVMPAVSWIQRRSGNELGSHSAVADSKQTLLCTYMSAALLVGLLANSAWGWWWADSVAALVIAALAVGEGINAWCGEVCCTPASALSGHDGCDEGCACC